MARQHRLRLAGLAAALPRRSRAPIEIGSLKALFGGLAEKFGKANGVSLGIPAPMPAAHLTAPPHRRRFFSAKFPLLLDDMILRDFAMYFVMILGSFITLTLVFTFFELLGDIVRNHISVITLGDYLLNVTPSMIYLITPLSVLLSVLVTFGLMQKSNELTAMKATGISIYRITLPVLVLAAAIASGLFFFDQLYLPYANKRQETLRNQIKNKPAQTYLRPDRKWISRRAEHDLLLRILRSRSEQVRQLLRVRFRSQRHFRSLSASTPNAPSGTTTSASGC
jgi:lipopolysaccharide export LptBFGC system permease protein LptF